MTDWTFRRPAEPVRRRPADRYLAALAIGLLGYAVAGRGFAYVGVPPLFVGEVLLAFGLLTVVTLRGRADRVPTLALRLLLGVVVWAAIRVVMGVPTWGLDAVRDGMLVVYGLFAVIAAALVMDQPERLRRLVRWFPLVVLGLAVVAWPVHFFMKLSPGTMPEWPWAPVEIVQTKPGDLLVLMATAVAFVVGGFEKPRPLVLAGLVAGTLGLMITSRGGMLGFVLGMGLVALWKPASARFGRLVYVGALLVMIGLAVGASGVQVNGGTREISLDQLVENVKSITGRSENSTLQGTAQWRLEWWGKIIGYTFGGRYFLDGKGFGINLASDDGFAVDEAESLRSPHNSHLNVLARGGVPMFTVWMAIQGLWLWTVGRAAVDARRRRLDAWAAFYAVCGAFWLGAHVNASFDVYLEGPMGAVWFWVVFGLALAGTRLQQTHPHLLDDLRVGAPPPVSGKHAGDGQAGVAPVWGWSGETALEPSSRAGVWTYHRS